MSTFPARLRDADLAGDNVDRLIDAAFVLVLSVLGLVGFQNTFGGETYLIVGGVAVALGIVIAELSQRLRQPVLVDALLTVAVFLLLGGVVAAPASAVWGVVPTPNTVTLLVGAAVQGWKELLTTAPPVGNVGNLLAIPYLTGLVAGVAGYGLARRTRTIAVPAIAPALVLALGILFGAEVPVALLLQGALFAALLLAWLTLRYRRTHPAYLAGTSRRRRIVAAVGIVAVAAALAPVVGPNLPLSGNQRVVLSRYVAPPFDASNQPSPLGTFRTYTAGSPHSLSSTTLFTVSGLQPGSLMTIATMDSYDGLAWGFGGEGASTTGPTSGDVFRRYGSAIPAAYSGVSETVTVRVDGLQGTWIPVAGEVTGIQFSGPGAAGLTADFRYDATTATGADTAPLSSGDSYTLDVIAPRAPTAAQLAAAAAGTDQLAVSVPTAVQTTAEQWAGGTAGAWNRVIALAEKLKDDGRFSNGTENPPLSTAGHSAGRLTAFVDGDPSTGTQLVGDDEQFAATLALMADAVGVPARVVLGAQVGAGGTVTGSDVHAWVQVSLAGLGWVTVAPSLFLPTRAAAQPLPQAEPTQLPQAVVAPPTVTELRPPPAPPLRSTAQTRPPVRSHPASHAGISAVLVDVLIFAGAPVLLLLLACAVILGLKAQRRRRRRVGGSTSLRFAGAWSDLLDHARDLGHVLPRGQTRREQARLIPAPHVDTLARTADAAVFGPGDPLPEHAAWYWKATGEARHALTAQSGPWRRLRAALSLTSLRSSRQL
ncbi:MAG: transglutaminase-like domain-containing protein [Candidatus Dormibacteria bacterium]